MKNLTAISSIKQRLQTDEDIHNDPVIQIILEMYNDNNIKYDIKLSSDPDRIAVITFPELDSKTVPVIINEEFYNSIELILSDENETEILKRSFTVVLDIIKRTK